MMKMRKVIKTRKMMKMSEVIKMALYNKHIMTRKK